MILEVTILILSVSLIMSLVFIRSLSIKNSKLNSQIIEMKDSVENKVKQLELQIKKQQEIVSIDVGDRAILPNYGLSHKPTNQSFMVTYEVEIVDVSTEKVKVNAIDYQSNDTFPSDPKNRQSIINFLQNHWVDRRDIQLIVDTEMRRENKLNQLLN